MPAAVQVECQGRSQAAGAAHTERVQLQAALALHADLGQDQVARVAGEVVGRQFRQGGGFGDGWHGSFQVSK